MKKFLSMVCLAGVASSAVGSTGCLAQQNTKGDSTTSASNVLLTTTTSNGESSPYGVRGSLEKFKKNDPKLFYAAVATVITVVMTFVAVTTYLTTNLFSRSNKGEKKSA